MVENSLDLSLLLAQTRQELAEAQARIAELEARLTPASTAPPLLYLAEHFQKLLKGCRIHFTLLNAQRQMLYTDAVDHLLGYSPEEYATIAPGALVHPDDQPRAQAFLQALPTTPNVVQTIEVRSRHKAGHYLWLEITAINLLNDPAIGALVLSSRDISEYKQATAALAQREALFRYTFEQAAIGIAHTGLDLHLLRFNQRLCEILGYTDDELAQQTVFAFTHPADSERDRQAVRQLLAGEISTHRAQKRYLHKNGKVVWVNLTVSLARTPDGQPDYFISTVEDITQLKQTEAALQRSSEYYQRVVEDQLDLICRYNVDFQLTFVNQAYCAAFGKTPAALLGVNLLTLIPPEDGDHTRAKVQALNSDHPVATSETSYILANGELHWFEWVDRALCDPAGNIVEYQGVGRDITAQKQLQQEQQRYTQAIEGMHQFLNATVDAISGNIAVLQTDGTILNVNQHWRRFAFFNGATTPTSYVGENYLTVCDTAAKAGAVEAAPVAAGIRAVIAGQREHFYVEYPCHSPIKEHWFGMRVTPFAEPPPRRVVVAHMDVTERVQAEQAERQQRVFAEALRDALAVLTSPFDVEQMMQQILAATSTVVPSEGGTIILFEGEWSRVAYLRGFSAEAVAYYKTACFPLPWFLHGNDIAQGQSYFTPDTQAIPDWFPLPGSEWIRSSMGAPIMLHGEVIGLLCADSAVPNYFQPADAEKLQVFARYASLALQNAQHLSQLETRVADRTAELQAEKERVEAILNHSFDGILLVQPDLRIAQTNAAFNQMFASAPDDTFAGTLSDLIYLEDVARTHTIIQRVLTTQVGEQIEIRCYHKDGTIFDAELSIGPLKDAGMVCTLRDITERKQAEQALQESQRFSQKITETVPNGIYIFDFQAQRNIYINQNVARLLGYAPEKMQGMDSAFVDQLMHPDDQPIFAAQLQQLSQANDDQIFEIEYRLRHADGTWRWFLSSDTVFTRDEAGRVQQVLGIATDITARKRMEEALRTSEAHYRLLADNVTDWISCTKLDGEITYASPSTRNLGYEPEELLGFAAYSLIHPDDLPLIQQELSTPPLLNGGLLTRTYRIRHKAGHYVWMETNSRQVYSKETGEIIEFIASSRDITERKQMEDALRKSEARYRLLAENIKDMIGCVDTLGICTYISPSCRTLLGYEPEELIGQSGYQLLHPDDIPMLQATQSVVLSKQAVPPLLTYRIRHKAGHYLWIEMNSRNVYDPATGEVIEFVNVSRDITERKQAEAALRASEARYRLLADNITDMVARITSGGEYTYVSPSAYSLLGYAPEELIGQSAYRFIHPDDLTHVQKLSTQAVQAQASSSTITCRMQHKAGHYRWLEFASHLQWSATTGQLEAATISARDVSERKQAEAALQRKMAEEREFRNYLQALHEVTMELAATDPLDHFYKRAVELGLEQLGFERLGLWLYDETDEYIQGSYGTDSEGKVIPEHHLRGRVADYPLLQQAFNSPGLFRSFEDTTWYTGYATAERSWGAICALRHDETKLGFLSTDNGVRHQPPPTMLADRLAIYSLTISTLLVRKRLTSALRESQAKFRRLLQVAPVAIVIADQNGQITLVNNQAERLFGYAPDELLNQPIEILIPEELRFAHTSGWTAYTSKPHAQMLGADQALFGRRKNGALFPIEIELGSMETAEGLMLMGFITDITERKQAAAALCEQRDFLQLIINNVPDLITVKDPEGRFQLVNTATARLHQLTPEEMIGKKNPEVNPNPTEIAFFQQTDRQALTGGQTVVIPEQTIMGRYYHTTKIPLKNAAGAFDRILIVSFDITERKAAEAAAREQGAFLQQVLDNIPAVITVKDTRGRFQLANREAAELYHASPDAMLGKTLADVHPISAQAALFEQEDQAVLQSGCASWLPEATSNERVYEVNRIPLKSVAGQIHRLLVVAIDITQRKQAEAAIQASERKYRQLVETMQSGLIIFDRDARATYVNDHFCEMSGYTSAEALGRSLYASVDGENANILQAQFEKRMQGKNAAYEVITRHKDGREMHLLVSASPLFNDEGEVTGSLAILVDIGPQKQIEAALRQSEQKYRHLVETMQGGLIIFDQAGRATYVNDRLCELLGYPREEILGNTAYTFVDEENARRLASEFAKRLTGENSAYELVAKRKDGQPIHLLVSGSPLLNDKQEVIGTMSVLVDIEPQKKAEATLRENLQKEKELGELKSRFVSMASHEFRTPLASILALTETLRAYRHRLADEQIEQRLGKIQEQIGYLKAIMEDVLQLARLQARRAEFNPVQIDLDALCHSVVEEFQNNPEQAKRLVYQGAPALQPSLVDKKLMRQVINNLIANGLKYSPADKPVTITLTQAANQLILTVQDQGIGIPEADLPHLFEPFHRAANVGTIAGTGLGLVITKESVELHGGTITVQSQTDIGTTVVVSIPYITNSTTPTQAAELIAKA